MAKRSELLSRWAQTSQSARHLNAILKHAAPYMTVRASELDAKPLYLNVRNGTLVVHRGPDGSHRVSLKSPDPEDLLTKVCAVPYDPAARCPVYDQALEFLQPDPEVRDFLHRLVGYAATGLTTEQKLVFFYGEGRNGKSTFMDTWCYVLGDYATTIPIETFLASAHSRDAAQASPHLARLAGVRLLRTSEPERGATLAEALIKLATSSEPMLVRHLHQDCFELRPQFKLFISGNYKPRIKGTDEGIWRRIILVPWDVKVSDQACDPLLSEKLKAEASGVLNHILDGICRWLDRGLAIPQVIADATADYRAASDHLGRFLSACVQNCSGGRVSSQELYDLYSAWAKATGAPLWTRTGFGLAMRDRGYRNTKSGTNFWLDIESVASIAEFQAAAGSSRDCDNSGAVPREDDIIPL